MSQKLSLWQKYHVIFSIVFWIVVTIAAATWLTAFLAGTLDGAFKQENVSAVKQDMFENVVGATDEKVKRYLGEWQFSEPKIPGHFHHIGRWYEADKWNFCINCHGPMSHSKTPRQRAFLNMHTLFMSCEVCHVQKQKGVAPTHFGWMDLKTGQLCANPTMAKGVWGEYGAKIVPLDSNESSHAVVLTEEEVFSEEFRKKMDKLDDPQKAVGNKFIHRRCIEKPVRCTDCHDPNKTFLPYTSLGYSTERATFLIGSEVADVAMRHDSTFYMPKLLDIGDRTQGYKGYDANEAGCVPLEDSNSADVNDIVASHAMFGTSKLFKDDKQPREPNGKEPNEADRTRLDGKK
jgi:hypothetical protein